MKPIAYKLTLAAMFALGCLSVASAGPFVYVATTNFDNFTGQFGTMDPTTGAFNQMGTTNSDPMFGLVLGPDGTLLGITASGNLDSINPVTGAISIVGATGLGNLAGVMGAFSGTVYATDLNNNLYTLDTTSGAATLIGPTGLPPCPSLLSPVEVSDEMLFTANGDLYLTFDGVNLSDLSLVDAPQLYQINPVTGAATLVGPTTLGLDAAAVLNGTVYGFAAGYADPNTVLSLNPANGSTSPVTNYNLDAFQVTGAVAPAPEPASFALAGIGMAALLFAGGRKRRSSFDQLFHSIGRDLGERSSFPTERFKKILLSRLLSREA